MTKLAVKSEPVEVTDEELEAQLPIPVGYHLLVAMPEVEDTYDSTSILKSVFLFSHYYHILCYDTSILKTVFLSIFTFIIIILYLFLLIFYI